MNFLYTVPTGFNHLQTNNLPEPTIKNGKEHFQAILSGPTHTIGSGQIGGNFSPYVTSSSGSWYGSGYDNTAMFDGLALPVCQTSNATGTATFTPPGGINYTTSVRVYSLGNAGDYVGEVALSNITFS